MTDILALATGLVSLVAGAELLVSGASSIATRAGISPLVTLAAVLCLPLFITGRRVSRLEGVFLLSTWIVWLWFRVTVP